MKCYSSIVVVVLGSVNLIHVLLARNASGLFVNRFALPFASLPSSGVVDDVRVVATTPRAATISWLLTSDDAIDALRSALTFDVVVYAARGNGQVVVRRSTALNLVVLGELEPATEYVVSVFALINGLRTYDAKNASFTTLPCT